MNPSTHSLSPRRPAQATRRWVPQAALLTLAVAAAFPQAAQAQSNKELLKELRELKARMVELEKKLAVQAEQNAQTAKAVAATPPVAAAAEPVAPGMTPEQLQDFNRIAVKTEALEDARDMMGFKGLKVSGYVDPAFIYNQRQHQAGFQFLNSVSDGGYTYDN